MDIESLKMVIDMMKEIGTNGREVFVWWLIAYYAKFYIFGFLWTGIGFFSIKSACNLIKEYTINNQFKQAAGVGIGWSDNEKVRAISLLSENQDYIKWGTKKVNKAENNGGRI